MIPLKCFLNHLVIISILIIGVFSDPPQKISGGRTDLLKNFPYQVSLRRMSNEFFCSGAIITKNHILTAAHCIEGENITNTVVVIGTNSLVNGGFHVKIKKMVMHPKFSILDDRLEYDIGVITLKTKLDVNYNPFIRRIPLLGRDIKSGDKALISGWGDTAENNIQNSILLQYIKAELTNSSECQKYFFSELSSTKQVCMFPVDGKNTCQGDSGSPVVVRSKLAGIVSFGGNCNKITAPSIFINTYAFLNFIKQETKRSLRYLLGKPKPKKRMQVS